MNLFSFNNPYGACPTREGFGSVIGIDPNLVIPDKSLSVYEAQLCHGKAKKWVNGLRNLLVLHINSISYPQAILRIKRKTKKTFMDRQ